MQVFGTTTSPFVRRLRVVAQLLGEPVELVSTADDAGQARLRTLTPLGKVPIAVVDGRTLFDSRVLIAYLVETRGAGALALPRDRWEEHNLVNAIDTALEATISLFYLRRDGVPIDGTPYAARQEARAQAIFTWLEGRLEAGARRLDSASGDGLDLATLSLVCALDWMDFRGTYPTARHPALEPVRRAWREHPALRATPPVA